VSKLANLEKLQDAIDKSGMTMTAIAKKSGILRETLYNRVAGKGEFKVSEVVGLTHTLNLSEKDRDSIFFEEWV
jgi:DNA-binding phage protein